MSCRYPTPRELGLRLPADIREDRFKAGFEYGLKGGKIDKVEYLRRSFRLGFRAAKLYLREVRRRQGIVEFPMRRKIVARALWH